MEKHYSANEKKTIVEEFLTIYKENSKLSARKFSINKFGTPNSLFHKWVKEYDINGIYKPINHHDRTRKTTKESSFVAIAKTPLIVNQSITININTMKISIPVNCSKKEFINILSALKEIS
jgi:transposase-like protein